MVAILLDLVFSAARTFLWVIAAILGLAILKLLTTYIRPYFSELRQLPGPSGGSWITGHVADLNRSQTDRAECILEWSKQYGHVFAYKSLLNSNRLVTTDPKALNHILANYMTYYKPEHLRLAVGQLIGEGLIFAEGSAHKRQRKVMNPAFSLGHIRELTDIFLSKSHELREALITCITEDAGHPINIIPFVSRCTLDILGLAGFDYDFNTVKEGSGKQTGESTNELAAAFTKAHRTDQGYAMMQMLYAWIPPLRWVMFDQATRASNEAQKTMRRIGRRLVEEKKRHLGFVSEGSPTSAYPKSTFVGSGREKDLLSLMIKANMSSDISPEQRMSDAEVMHQIPTFIVAGHETTATALIWSLYSLAVHKDVQRRLRQELLTLSSDTPTMDELNSLSYFDMVIKECLRHYSPFENTLRVAQSDDVIPVEKPFYDRKGRKCDRIIIRKGDGIFLPLLAMNRLESIWGPDAAEFKPERWSHLPETVNTVPGVWGNQFTFLGGPRSCIGYRFAVMEMKAILYILFRAFEFDLAVKEEDVLKTSVIVTKPLIRGQTEKGSLLPMIIKPVTR
ncbi:cytochrome P450 [Serendipita vermifera]|nr:cytochrome P450 [Serendipita vermifera]